jgi:Bacteriocin-protection, YdeI or OmpD-Associated/Domain of unknown function (DUF1905)
MSDEGAAHAFKGVIRREGPLYLADVPLKVSRALAPEIAAHASAGRLPVVATLGGGAPFIATLVPRGGGAHKIFLNGEVRMEAGASVGDRVAITVRVDTEPRGAETPGDLAHALREAALLAAFERAAPGKRQHIIDWVERVQSEDARERRIAKVVEQIAAQEEKRADRAAKLGR